MKQIDYCCPDITCRAFGDPYPIKVWEEGDIDEYDGLPIESQYWGDPYHDDEVMCGNHYGQTVPREEFNESLEALLKPSQSHS